MTDARVPGDCVYRRLKDDRYEVYQIHDASTDQLILARIAKPFPTQQDAVEHGIRKLTRTPNGGSIWFIDSSGKWIHHKHVEPASTFTTRRQDTARAS